MLKDLNTESLLMLYLADELSAPDRQVVAERLAGDAGMRLELERLSGAVQSFSDHMAALDALPLPSESAATRRIGMAIRQSLADRVVRAEPTAPARVIVARYPWWVYSGAAAAALLVAALGWWGRQPSETMYQYSTHTEPTLPVPPSVAMSSSGAVEEGKQMAEGIFAPSSDVLTGSDKAGASLKAAEEQIAELSRSSSEPVPSYFGFSDGNE